MSQLNCHLTKGNDYSPLTILICWQRVGRDMQVPDGSPHIEAIQRLGPIGASASQIHQCREPIRDVDELPALHAFLFQQGACHKAHSTDASFPQGPFPSSKRPVVAPRQSLPTIVWNTDKPGHECTKDIKMESLVSSPNRQKNIIGAAEAMKEGTLIHTCHTWWEQAQDHSLGGGARLLWPYTRILPKKHPSSKCQPWTGSVPVTHLGSQGLLLQNNLWKIPQFSFKNIPGANLFKSAQS